MNWDELEKMRKIVDEADTLKRLVAPQDGGVVAALRELESTNVGAIYAAQIKAQQQREAEKWQRQLATSATAGVDAAALRSVTEHFATQEACSALASGLDHCGSASATFAAQLEVRQRLDLAEQKRLFDASAIGEINTAALRSATDYITSGDARAVLASAVDIAPTLASMRVADEAVRTQDLSRLLTSGSLDMAATMSSLHLVDRSKHAQDLANLLNGGMATNLASAEEGRLRAQVAGVVSANYPAAADQAVFAKAYEEQVSRYLRPGIEATEHILGIMRGNFFSDLQDRYGNQLPGAQAAMLRMQAPWLDSLHAVSSIRGFAEMQAIGGALDIAPAFDRDFSAALRRDLGDWRDSISNWPSTYQPSAEDRRALYLERGFNPDLTDFPEDAFDESLSIAKIKGAQPLLVVEYGQLSAVYIDSNDEEDLKRTNEAHDHLQRTEFQLRKFIDASMRKACGPNWPKHRLPNGLYDKWMSKKEANKGAKVERPLIFYADFSDYKDVICRKDNWEEVFVSTFQRQEDVRESLQRMHPIRLAIAHSRPIDKEDSLTFYTESRRLLNVIQLVV